MMALAYSSWAPAPRGANEDPHGTDQGRRTSSRPRPGALHTLRRASRRGQSAGASDPRAGPTKGLPIGASLAVGQSGGPTAVINASPGGIIAEARGGWGRGDPSGPRTVPTKGLAIRGSLVVGQSGGPRVV